MLNQKRCRSAVGTVIGAHKNVQTPPARQVSPRQPGEVHANLQSLIPPRPCGCRQVNTEGLHDRGAKLRKRGRGHVYGSRDDPLPSPQRKPEQDGEHTPGRGESLCAPPAAWKVTFCQRHNRIKVRRGHAHVAKERATLSALLIKSTNKVASVARSTGSLSTDVCEVGQFRHL